MVEATDELRERLADVIGDYPGSLLRDNYDAADRVLAVVAAVVAEARTEGAIAESELSKLVVKRLTRHNEVGNQNAEPEGES